MTDKKTVKRYDLRATMAWLRSTPWAAVFVTLLMLSAGLASIFGWLRWSDPFLRWSFALICWVTAAWVALSTFGESRTGK